MSTQEEIVHYRNLAETGDAAAQCRLGWMYQNGKGVPMNYVEALKWFRKAAIQGNTDAQNNLGRMYQHGKGVPQSDTEAMKWYHKAAVQGNTDAQNNWKKMKAESIKVDKPESEPLVTKELPTQNFPNQDNGLNRMRFEASTESGSLGFAEVDTSVALGRGGVAVIHPAMFDGNSCAAKIFNSNRVVNADKIMAMIANPPDSLWITVGTRTYPKYGWPTSLLRSPQGPPVGFLMPVVDQTESFTFDCYYDKTLIKKLESPEEVALSFKLEIASNLSRSVSELHKHGHYFIDLKPQNIRVFRRTHIVTLIDCDGFSIQGIEKRFPAEMLSADYIAPEAYRGNIYPQNLSEPQDRYALAVILFQLLNGGTHPFQGIVTDANISANTNDEKAAAGLYPHGLTPNPRILPRPQSIHSCFDDETRSLFDLSFTGTQSERPSAEKWAQHFKRLLDDKALVRCDGHPFDIRHMRFQGKTCPTCHLEIISRQRTRVLPGTATIKPTPTTKPVRLSATDSTGGFKLIGGVMGFILIMLFIIGLNMNSPKSIPPRPPAQEQMAPEPAPAPAPAREEMATMPAPAPSETGFNNTNQYYSWENPWTKLHALMNTKWKHSIQTDKIGGELHIFSGQDTRTFVTISVEQRSGLSLSDYVRGFQKSDSGSKISFTDGGRLFNNKGGGQTWQGSGVWVEKYTGYGINIQITQVGSAFWRVVSGKEIPYDETGADDKQNQMIQNALWDTIR